MRRNRKAKIIATLGPASSDYKTIKKLFISGADIFRLNFSHDVAETHIKRFKEIRLLEKKVKRPIGILMDLQGPKLRVGKFDDGPIFLKSGRKFTFDLNPMAGNKRRCFLPHKDIFRKIKKGNKILVDDGKLTLIVTRKNSNYIETKVKFSGFISSNKGFNIPNVKSANGKLTKKDEEDLRLALKLGVDWIALSFVETEKDVLNFKKIIKNKASVLTKLEKPIALKNLNKIIKVSDAIMIARGDLGIESPLESLPSQQKRIINACRQEGKPVVVATQMLDSMVNYPTPTRAEASDVATAIYDGTDAVMLSAETAIGAYPNESIKMMNKIIEKVESDPLYLNINEASHVKARATAEDAITESAKYVARIMSAKAVVTYTTSGSTALRAARERPDVPIMGISPNLNTARRLALAWGVHCIHTKDARSFKDMVIKSGKLAKKEKFAKKGDRVVITAGVPFGQSGATNVLRIASVDRY
ncbi:MAG: Pyruvate kinase [Alphaproteobacteria bacterium MarineAlpha6_Bin4]|nr:MAG: Pyruvate kinase [Alphaproteobacteria bacterium MarineAlpha6_Bin3]PPR38014.1 MAG: Pyruvate kinase [Alphaproteobacteria bacterium MarineAlpha6_Bin4]|tara:strand:+ start:847 stop:2268 length:1422 start_codon:yes stop_codon:yes gene_type:complete